MIPSSRPSTLAGRAAVTVAALAAIALPASARAAQPPSVVVWAAGPRHDAARADVAAALAGDYTVMDEGPFLEALGRDAHAKLGAALRDRAARARLVERVRSAARAAGAADVVVVGLEPKGGRASVLAVHATGDEASVTRGARGGIGDAARRELAKVQPPAEPAPPPAAPPPIAAAEPPPAAPPEAAAEPVAEASSAKAASPDRGVSDAPPAPHHLYGRALFDVSVGGEVGARHFRYSDGLTTNLRDYQLGAAPLAAVEGALYPLAASRIPVLSDVGLTGGFATAFALESTPADGGTVGTAWRRFHAGARLRVRTGAAAASPVLGASVAYGAEAFALASTSVTQAPSVDYRFVRPAIDARVPLGRAAAFAGVAYMATLSAGDVADRFPRASVAGVEGDLGGAFTIVPGLEARVTVSYRRFFYSMHPVPGDAFVAGGALDELMGLQGSVAYVY